MAMQTFQSVCREYITVAFVKEKVEIMSKWFAHVTCGDLPSVARWPSRVLVRNPKLAVRTSQLPLRRLTTTQASIATAAMYGNLYLLFGGSTHPLQFVLKVILGSSGAVALPKPLPSNFPQQQDLTAEQAQGWRFR